MGEWDATRVFPEEGLKVGREKIGVDDKQLTVFLLPLVTVRLN